MIHRKDNSGNLFIISGPSGSGKNTLIEAAIREDPTLRYSISVTTRKPRVGETEGNPYFFTDKDSFKKKIENQEFIEWAMVHDNYYGTLYSQVDKIIAENKNVIMDLDVQGASRLKDKVKNGVFIFITPPSYEILKERIKNRATDSAETIDLRMRNALDEVKKLNNFDFVVINEDLDKAKNTLLQIIDTCKSQTCHFFVSEDFS